MSAAAVLVWLGMVIAISFIEAPLKFRAPGVTLPIGLGIGRLVFRALNIAEGLLAALALAGTLLAGIGGAALSALGLAVIVLVVQVAAVRPALSRRSDRVLAGETGPRSHAHLIYVALEVLKVAALATAGVLLLKP
ncbi:hypothetical protein [Catenuloplanes atrovinosus]|uniref:Transmembrane protein n=1 Tax=Catenuloplanes atrovinosus TaxID=137266 RepID=A0AAE3YMW6_9ACTN|nr:hypothetical protein [Catenuloplanes atrovinosus]MDR7275103.1 hypothetical protein [Catenuloplanes atrovinosus]